MRIIGTVLCLGFAGTLLLAAAPTPAQSSEFTNRDFLAWEKRDRDQWLEGAMLMAGIVVFLQDQEKAQCVWDWYLKTPSETQAQIFASMQRYPDALPTATVLALAEFHCGKPLIE